MRAASLPERVRRGLGLAALLGLSLVTPRAHGAEPRPPSTDDLSLFDQGKEALGRGDHERAIEAFEALADRGLIHPDLSFDRGLAYVLRVKAKAEKPGDLGRAAAGFAEALSLRPGDTEADRALDQVRAELARRRSKRAKDGIDARPTLDRALLRLLSPRAWAGLGALASLLLGLGLLLRPLQGRPHLVGAILAPLAGLALVVLGPLGYAASRLESGTRAGIVVSSELPLVSPEEPEGRPSELARVPEGSEVEVGERREGKLFLRWGAQEGWAPASGVQLLGLP